MFGKKPKQPEPESRYYAELIEGDVYTQVPHVKTAASEYSAQQRSYQKEVQEALDKGWECGWTLVNVASPSVFLSISDGSSLGAMSPTLLFWDTGTQENRAE